MPNLLRDYYGHKWFPSDLAECPNCTWITEYDSIELSPEGNAYCKVCGIKFHWPQTNLSNTAVTGKYLWRSA